MDAQDAAAANRGEGDVEVDHGPLEALGGGALDGDVERGVEAEVAGGEALAPAEGGVDDDVLALAAVSSAPIRRCQAAMPGKVAKKASRAAWAAAASSSRP